MAQPVSSYRRRLTESLDDDSPTCRRWLWKDSEPISPSNAPVESLNVEKPQDLSPWSDDDAEPLQLIVDAFFKLSIEQAARRIPILVRGGQVWDEVRQDVGRQSFSGLSPDERKTLREQIDSLALICRFHPEYYWDVHRAYKISRRDDIVEEQLKLAKFQKNISLHGMSTRASLSEQFEYWSFRATIAKGAKLGLDAMAFSEKRVVHKKTLRTPITGRYEYTVRRFLPRFSLDLVNTKFTVNLVDGRKFEVNDNESYIVQYPDPKDPTRSIPLTANLKRRGILPGVEYPLWLHVDPERIPILTNHLDGLYEKLKVRGRKMLESPSDETKRAFLLQLSHVYWLAAHLTLTCRGNGQNCLNFLYREMKVHGLLPLIPKVGCLPDCIALSTPLTVFQESFLILFEPEEALERLLERL